MRYQTKGKLLHKQKSMFQQILPVPSPHFSWVNLLSKVAWLVTLSADFGNCRSYYNWSLPVFFVLLGKRFLSDRYRVFTIPFINITYSKSTSGRNHTIIIEAAMNTYLVIKLSIFPFLVSLDLHFAFRSHLTLPLSPFPLPLLLK